MSSLADCKCAYRPIVRFQPALNIIEELELLGKLESEAVSWL